MTGDNPKIDDIREYHTNNRVHFQLKLNDNILQKFEFVGFEEALKLIKQHSTDNQVLFNSDSKIKKY